MKRLFVFLFAVACVLGSWVAGAPTADAVPIHYRGTADLDPPNDEALCIRINVTVFGTAIGTGPDSACIPLP